LAQPVGTHKQNSPRAAADCKAGDLLACVQECDAPNADPFGLACERVRVAYSNGEAIPLFERECERTAQPNSCYGIAMAYLAGNNGKRSDVPRAVSLFQRACDGGFAESCERLALLYLTGYGRELPVNRYKANDFLRRACALTGVKECNEMKASFDNWKTVENVR
jgi:TPR repeat protein